MMIESLNPDLPAHRGAPDKEPARRLATLPGETASLRPLLKDPVRLVRLLFWIVQNGFLMGHDL